MHLAIAAAAMMLSASPSTDVERVVRARQAETLGLRPFDVDNLQVVDCNGFAIVSYVLTVYRNDEEGAPFDRRRRVEIWEMRGQATQSPITN